MAPKKKKRRQGGQPHNKNALKHGYYSSLYSAADFKRQAQPARVEDEQELVRHFILQLAEDLRLQDPTNKDLAIFNALLLAVDRVNTIERTILLARGKGGEIGETILEALRGLDPTLEL